MQAARRSATRRRCSTSRNARMPPSDDNSPPSNLTTTGLPPAGDRPDSGSIGSFMAGVAQLKSRESASITRFYAKSEFDRRYGPQERSHPGRQPARSPRADRGGLNVSLSRTGQRDLESPPGGTAEIRAQHRLEGAGPAVRPLSPAQRHGQEAAHRRSGDRSRDSRVPVAIGREVAPA